MELIARIPGDNGPVAKRSIKDQITIQRAAAHWAEHFAHDGPAELDAALKDPLDVISDDEAMLSSPMSIGDTSLDDLSQGSTLSDTISDLSA